jgi:hypothetical protein
MKRMMLVLLVAMLPASAQDWKSSDVILESTAQALIVADWLQTAQIERKTQAGCPIHETNPLIGNTCNRGRLNRYFAASMVLQFLAVRFASDDVRPWIEAVSIGVEAGCVGNNYSLGIRVPL